MPLEICFKCHETYPMSMLQVVDQELYCRGCVTGKNITKAEEKLKSKALAVAKQFDELKNDEINSGQKVRGILEQVYKEFGGASGFASHLHWIIMELSTKKPMPHNLGQLMLNMLRLHHQIEQGEEQVIAREMSDEQLRKETELATLRLFVESANDPKRREMLRAVLGKYGLEITEVDPTARIAEIAHESNETDRSEEGVGQEGEGVPQSLPSESDSGSDLQIKGE